MKNRRECEYFALKNNLKIMRDFVSAIVFQSVADYCRAPKTRKEVRRFLKDEWGEHLCDFLDLNAADILNKLRRGKINRKGL